MDVHDVFTPGQYPKHTYVERIEGEYEDSLEFSLRGGATIVSLAGPSKSGKTMLLSNVLDKLGYGCIRVSGSDIDSAESLWNRVLDALQAPVGREISEEEVEETERGFGGSLGLDSTNFSIGTSSRDEEVSGETAMHERRGLQQVADILDLDEFVLYIDDAHYIDEEHHGAVAETLKEAHERGMKVCVAFIPHRSEDLTRANPDLRGRVDGFSIDYWDNRDLEKIAEKGFQKLNRYPPDLLMKNLAIESIGSPHLMQDLCLKTCGKHGILEPADEMTPIQIKTTDIESILTDMGGDLHYETVFEILCGDAVESGNKRNIYTFKPGRTEGDVYDCVLRAIASNPPQLALNRGEILDRIASDCKGDPPRTWSVSQAISRMDDWISERLEESHVFDWEEERNTLEIPDPYLIFYLRWSDALDFKPKLQQ